MNSNGKIFKMAFKLRCSLLHFDTKHCMGIEKLKIDEMLNNLTV